MQDFDTTLKLLIRELAPLALRTLTGVPIARWLTEELPKTQNLRLVLLGEDASGNLWHIELQSDNDANIGARMAEYRLGIYRITGKFARQIVLYVGRAPLSMPTELRAEGFLCQYRVVDVRELDGAALLASENIGDNVIAILTRMRDNQETVREIVARIGRQPEGERHIAITQLLILAGLRGLAKTAQKEIDNMPLTIDIMANEVLGPAIQSGIDKGIERGIEKGIQQGIERGIERGIETGERRLLRRALEKRFGPLPPWAQSKLAALSTAQIEDRFDRTFDAQTLEDLLP